MARSLDGASALVTGGAGLIGSHVVDLLLERGCKVVILDNLEKQTHRGGKPPRWIPKKAKLLRGDVRRKADLKAALKGVDFVFHEAAYGGFTPEISKYYDANVTGTARLFEAINEMKEKPRKVVVASSQAIYGEGAYRCAEHGMVHPGRRAAADFARSSWEPNCPSCGLAADPMPTPETVNADPWLPYSISKYGEERAALALGERFGVPTTALRYGVTYGPRQSLFNPYTGVVSIFCTRIANGLAPVVYEDGRQTRDFTFVGDVARANLFAAERPETDFGAFNVCTGRGTRVSELARLLARLLGREGLEPEIRGEFRPGDSRHLVLDGGKLAALGFAAQVPLERGLELFLGWLNAQGKVKEYFTSAERELRRWGVVKEGARR